jgi:hypothetical protein
MFPFFFHTIPNPSSIHPNSKHIENATKKILQEENFRS